jgi:hypothetical protein
VRGFWFDALALGAACAVRLYTPPAGWIEAHYANGAYPAIDRGIRALTGPLPFCVADVLLALALGLLGSYWYGALRASRGGLLANALRALLRTLAAACALYLWFMFAWAFDYSRVPLADKIPVHDERSGEDAVNRLADHVVDELTRLAPAAHREPPASAGLGERLEPTFERAIARLGDRAAFAPPHVKPTLFQPLFAASGTTGFTDPWTHEVSLDASLFPIERPAIYAHEWSHLAGFNDESEANFIAVLACTTSRDPLLQYSGWLLVWENLPAGVHLTHRMGRTAYRDLVAIRARYLKNVNPRVERASRAAYDGYLKSNHVKAGYASYGLFVRWLTGADFDRDGLPLVRSESS